MQKRYKSHCVVGSPTLPIRSSYRGQDMKNLDDMGVAELEKLVEDAKGRIVAAREREKATAREKIKKILEDSGFALEELFPTTSATRPRKSRNQRRKKYRDPDTGATWGGLGRKPKWLVEAESAGRLIEDFEI